MHSRLKSALQYLLALGITGALIWLSLQSLQLGEGQNKTEFLWETWERSSKLFLLLMALTVTFSHIIRAERWRILLHPTQHNISLSASFLSVMIGYLINLVIPRGGEVSRCYNLYKLEKTPVEVSFGTVVVERIIDVLCLLVIIIISFVAEWTRLRRFMETLEFGGANRSISPWIFVVIGAIVAAVGAGVYVFKRSEKFKKIVAGFKEGFMAVFRLRQKGLFVFYTVAIWLLYFLMSYFVIRAFPETSDLGFSAVLTLFAIGALAMAAPLPGGAGSYHTLVPLGLVMLYNLDRSDAIAFVFIFHAWQTLIVIVFGLVSLLISYALIKWNIRLKK